MNNFKLVDSGIDTTDLLAALDKNPKLWNTLDYRKRGDTSAHYLVNDIIVRFDDPAHYTAGVHCINYKYYDLLSPALDDMINLVKDRLQATKIGRVVVTKINPGRKVLPHVDTEVSVKMYKRYHVCLYGAEGNMFSSGDETVTMRTGELWWFENKITHSCENTGSEDRVHLIFDVA